MGRRYQMGTECLCTMMGIWDVGRRLSDYLETGEIFESRSVQRK